MKPLFWVGLIVLVLGIASFVVPIPRSQTHGVKVGDASIGVTTKSSEKLSPAIGGILCVVGAGMMIGGAKKA